MGLGSAGGGGGAAVEACLAAHVRRRLARVVRVSGGAQGGLGDLEALGAGDRGAHRHQSCRQDGAHRRGLRRSGEGADRA